MEFIEGHYYLATRVQDDVSEVETLTRKGSIRKCVSCSPGPLGMTNVVFSITEDDIAYHCKKYKISDYEEAQSDLLVDWSYESGVWQDITTELLQSADGDQNGIY